MTSGSVPLRDHQPTRATGRPSRRAIHIQSALEGRPLSVIGSDQGPALGSAVHAAVAAGAYPGIE
ncbi:hypothetical protein ACWCSD_48125, partial [Nonomuraea sp. NPDC001684]